MSFPFERCWCGHIRASHGGTGGRGGCSACRCAHFHADIRKKTPAKKY